MVGEARRLTYAPQQRMYMCKVAGCGKCFARGEHLKRHVRSIHTNEKRESLTLAWLPAVWLVLTPFPPFPQRTSARTPGAARTSAATTTLGSTCVCTRASRCPRAAACEVAVHTVCVSRRHFSCSCPCSRARYRSDVHVAPSLPLIVPSFSDFFSFRGLLVAS